MSHIQGMNNSATQPAATTETRAYEAIRLAQVHEHEGRMPASATLAAEDAEACFNRGDYAGAVMAAKRSLSYSVGLFHPDYARV